MNFFENDSILFDRNPCPMWVFDIETYRILQVNKAAIEVYGYSREEFLSLTIKDLRSTKDISGLASLVRRPARYPQNMGIWRHCDKNGKEFYVEILVESFEVDQRKLKIVQSRIVTSLSEDTELLQATQREMFYHLNNTSLGIVEWDSQFRLASISKHFSELTGYSRDDLIGKNIVDIAVTMVAREDLEKALKIIRNLFKSPLTTSEFDLKIYAKDGSTKYLRCYTSILRDKDQRLVSIFSMFEDLTDQKAFETEMGKMLQEKRVLLAEVHHRVKNNLAIISGLLQMQSFSIQNPKVQQILSESQLRIQSIALVHEKLYQMESLADIRFHEYIKELAGSVKQVFDDGNKIKLEINCDSIELNVNQAVPCALIINEFVTNAFKYAFSDTETGQIDIEARIDEDTEIVSMVIKDNGKGLPTDFDEKKTTSLGYLVIDTLMKQLNAGYQIQSRKGTKVSFSFKREVVKGSSNALS